MTHGSDSPAEQAVPRAGTTPAGIQLIRDLSRRRVTVLLLNVATYAALGLAAAQVFGAEGWTLVDILMFTCFLIGTPWTVLGFWNAILGLWLLHGVDDGLDRVAPFAALGASDTPLAANTAILMTLRNEDPSRALARLRIVKESIDQTGEGTRFGYFILSDTSDPAVAEAEEKAVAAWCAEAGSAARIVYRRRTENTGYKAGNLRDFCQRWGQDFTFMLPLDADSLMAGETIIRLVRMMQARPRLGILQTLVVGMPSQSAFARIFQFGMRHGMRPYTMGSAWWIGDCGPFWGHNALVRIAPYRDHCDLPVVPGGPPFGGHVLSHDQVEATLMRRAGFEVRVLPVEAGTWEENPPTLLEFSRRDVRWCQGNLQYLRLLHLPGLLPLSRFQLVWAILMFIGVPAWTLLIALLPAKLMDGESGDTFPTALAMLLYVGFHVMYLMPKIAGLIDTLLMKGGVARYGGVGRFAAGAGIEIVFSFLQGAVTTFRITIFMIGLAFGRTIVWGGQSRDVTALSWRGAFLGLWPQMLFGGVVTLLLALLDARVLAWASPLLAGFIVAMPFAVLTAAPRVGAWFARLGLAGIPEDFDPPREIRALQSMTGQG